MNKIILDNYSKYVNMEFMRSKKKTDLTIEWLIEVGIPPIFATIIIKRINELYQNKSSTSPFKPDDFKSLPIWPKDREELSDKLNRALND